MCNRIIIHVLVNSTDWRVKLKLITSKQFDSLQLSWKSIELKAKYSTELRTQTKYFNL